MSEVACRCHSVSFVGFSFVVATHTDDGALADVVGAAGDEELEDGVLGVVDTVGLVVFAVDFDVVGVALGVVGVVGVPGALVASAATTAGLATLALPSWFTAALRVPAADCGCGLKICADGVVELNQVSGSHQVTPLLGELVAVVGAGAAELGALEGTEVGEPLGAGTAGAEVPVEVGCEGAGVVDPEDGAGTDGCDPVGTGAPGCRTLEPDEAGAAGGLGEDGCVVPGAALDVGWTRACLIAFCVVPAGQEPVVAGAAWAMVGRITPPATSTAGRPVAAMNRARLPVGAAGASSVLAVAVKASSPQGCVLGRGQRRDDVLRRPVRRDGFGYGV